MAIIHINIVKVKANPVLFDQLQIDKIGKLFFFPQCWKINNMMHQQSLRYTVCLPARCISGTSKMNRGKVGGGVWLLADISQRAKERKHLPVSSH